MEVQTDMLTMNSQGRWVSQFSGEQVELALLLHSAGLWAKGPRGPWRGEASRRPLRGSAHRLASPSDAGRPKATEADGKARRLKKMLRWKKRKEEPLVP